MIVAVVPAAGKSERMGRQKLLLPLGSKTVLEHVLVALAQSPIDRSFVVIPPGAQQLRELALQYENVQVVELENATPDMKATVVQCLDRIEASSKPPPHGFLLTLADQPAIAPDVVRSLIHRFQSGDRPAIVVPTWNGKNGHPVLFAWSLVPTIRSLSKDRGLNYLLSSGNQSVAAVPADDAERPDDLDTPEDYDRHRRRIETP